MCAGYHLALLELKILAVYVCQQYDFKCSFAEQVSKIYQLDPIPHLATYLSIDNVS